MGGQNPFKGEGQLPKAVPGRHNLRDVEGSREGNMDSGPWAARFHCRPSVVFFLLLCPALSLEFASVEH